MNKQTEIQKAIQCLLNLGTLVYPTETVLGIGCIGTDFKAVEKLTALKQRPKDKSFILLMDNIEMVKQFIPTLDQKEVELLHSDQATTVVFSSTMNLPGNVLAKDGSIGIRLAKHPFCIELIKGIKAPLVSTSANLSGEPTAKSWKDLNPVILDSVDYSLNLQSDFITSETPSRIVRVVNEEVIFIRK